MVSSTSSPTPKLRRSERRVSGARRAPSTDRAPVESFSVGASMRRVGVRGISRVGARGS